MDEINAKIKVWKRQFMDKMINWTDNSYFILRNKQTPNADDLKFIDAYENNYAMNVITTLALTPAILLFVKLQKLRR